MMESLSREYAAGPRLIAEYQENLRYGRLRGERTNVQIVGDSNSFSRLDPRLTYTYKMFRLYRSKNFFEHDAALMNRTMIEAANLDGGQVIGRPMFAAYGNPSIGSKFWDESKIPRHVIENVAESFMGNLMENNRTIKLADIEELKNEANRAGLAEGVNSVINDKYLLALHNKRTELKLMLDETVGDRGAGDYDFKLQEVRDLYKKLNKVHDRMNIRAASLGLVGAHGDDPPLVEAGVDDDVVVEDGERDAIGLDMLFGDEY